VVISQLKMEGTNELPVGTANSKPEAGIYGHAKARSRIKYEHFGETIRYLTYEELQNFFDAVTDYRHKLMMRLIYELGCRVGEFVRIQLKHLNFQRSAVFFPAENTKTGKWRFSYAPRGLMNEIQCLLKQDGRMAKREGRIRNPESYLFHPPGRAKQPYTENRVRQIARHYLKAAGLDHCYGLDSRGRSLHRLTVHSMRHSHLMHYIHIHKLPLPVVQKQVGHKTLKATSVYLRPSDETVAAAYEGARALPLVDQQVVGTISPQSLNSRPSLSRYHDKGQIPQNRSSKKSVGGSLSEGRFHRGESRGD
jgi:integrase